MHELMEKLISCLCVNMSYIPVIYNIFFFLISLLKAFFVVVVVYMPSCLYTELKDLQQANTGAQAMLRKCYNYLVTLPIC